MFCERGFGERRGDLSLEVDALREVAPHFLMSPMLLGTFVLRVK
jgi:hypothetical protein